VSLWPVLKLLCGVAGFFLCLWLVALILKAVLGRRC